jgi:hypothetical protein
MNFRARNEYCSTVKKKQQPAKPSIRHFSGIFLASFCDFITVLACSLIVKEERTQEAVIQQQ